MTRTIHYFNAKDLRNGETWKSLILQYMGDGLGKGYSRSQTVEYIRKNDHVDLAKAFERWLERRFSVVFPVTLPDCNGDLVPMFPKRTTIAREFRRVAAWTDLENRF